MEPDLQSVTLTGEDSDTRITDLMVDHQPPHDAVPQDPSDGEPALLSNTSTHPATPPVSHPAAETTSMPDESVIPCPTPSDSLPESPQNAPETDDCPPAIIPDDPDGTQQTGALSSEDSARYSAAPSSDDNTESIHEYGNPLIGSSAPSVSPPCPLLAPLPESDVEEDHSSGSRDGGVSGTANDMSQNPVAVAPSSDDNTESIHECENPIIGSSAPSVPSPYPLLVPLPESDVEEDHSSESSRDGGVSGTANGMSQNPDTDTTSSGGDTSPSGNPDPLNEAQPSTADDHLALWMLGDTVLERHDRRVCERWKAGLGVTFVLANILSVIILCIALEIYRRTKAAHPALVSKIRARHRARTGKDSPFSPIISLFFEADAPYLNSNTSFLMGLCTTLICTLLSDMALRWVARYEDSQPPPSATPRERMVARMEWNEHLERYAVPSVLEIGIPGLLYVALFFFFVGAISRAFPSLNTPVCWAFGVVCLVFSLRELWRFEPALDARLRPKPFSSSTRR